MITFKKVINPYVLFSDISDNFPLHIKVKHCNVKKNSLKNKNQYYQDYSKINSNELLTDASHMINKPEKNLILQTQLIQSLMV